MPAIKLVAVIGCLVLVSSGGYAASAATDTAATARDAVHRDIIMRDLFAVISLSGLSCEKVIDYEFIDDLDYVAVCQNGYRYRINVTPEGNVSVNSHKD